MTYDDMDPQRALTVALYNLIHVAGESRINDSDNELYTGIIGWNNSERKLNVKITGEKCATKAVKQLHYGNCVLFDPTLDWNKARDDIIQLMQDTPRFWSLHQLIQQSCYKCEDNCLTCKKLRKVG